MNTAAAVATALRGLASFLDKYPDVNVLSAEVTTDTGHPRGGVHIWDPPPAELVAELVSVERRDDARIGVTGGGVRIRYYVAPAPQAPVALTTAEALAEVAGGGGR